MIVIDASLALKLFLNEPDSPQFRRVWQRWEQAGEVLIAPPLFRSETLSVLRRSVFRSILSPLEGDQAFALLERLEIEIHEPPGLYRVAWDLSQRFNRPTVYDCCYLALAASSGCDFWTADRRLVNAVSASLPWVRSP